MNQSTNSRKDSSWARSLPKCQRMSKFFVTAGIPKPRDEFISQEALQEMFNSGENMARVERGELIPCLKRVAPVKVGGNLDGMCSYLVGYDDPETGLRSFLVQYFMSDDGVIGASGMEDPKMIYADGVFYKTRIPVEDEPILDGW